MWQVTRLARPLCDVAVRTARCGLVQVVAALDRACHFFFGGDAVSTLQDLFEPGRANRVSRLLRRLQPRRRAGNAGDLGAPAARDVHRHAPINYVKLIGARIASASTS